MPPAATADAPPLAEVRAVGPADRPAIAALHDTVFGPGALTRTAYRVREGAPPFSPFCRVSLLQGELVAAIRFTEIAIGDTAGALLLGPLCVATARSGQGYGKALVAAGLQAADAGGIALVVLVGNASYYDRFGFRAVPVGQILLPGPVDLRRILAVELQGGARQRFRGMMRAAGRAG